MLSLLAGFFQTRHLYSGWDPALCQTKNTVRNRESRSDRPRNKENGERYRLLLSTLLTATLNVTVIMTCDLDFQLPASYGHDPCTWKNQSQRSVSSKATVKTNTNTTELPFPLTQLVITSTIRLAHRDAAWAISSAAVSYLLIYFFIYFLTVSIKPIYLKTCGTDLCQISFLIFRETLPWQPIFVILSTQLSFGDIR